MDEKYIITDKDYINNILDIKKNKISDFYLSKTKTWMLRNSLEDIKLNKQYLLGNKLFYILENLHIFTSEEESTVKEKNFFLKLIEHIQTIVKTFIQWIKSFIISSVNFVKYVFKWIQEKTGKHNDLWMKYKDLIHKIPYDLSMNGIPFREDFFKNSQRIMEIIDNTPVIKIIEECGVSLKGIANLIKQKKQNFLKDVLKIESISFTNPNTILKMYEDFNLFTTSITKTEIDPKVSHEKQMKEKLNIEFYGKIEVPEKTAINCKKFLTPSNLLALTNPFINQIKKNMNVLKDLNGKITQVVVATELFYKGLSMWNDLFYKQVDEAIDKEERQNTANFLNLAIKYSKLINLIVNNFKFTVYEVSITSMKFRNQVASMLKTVRAKLESDMEEQIVFK